jgi:pyruvate ferredoxin oxidoreductase alpha subunit
MNIKDRLSGNEAVAYAMKQMNIDVVAAFPITPSTEIPQYFSQYVNNGEVETQFVPVESEHSSMSACIGAEVAGARASTATSSNGMSLMNEMLHIASALRLPISMAAVNRAVTGPININCDYSDSMGAKDTGWVQIYAENAQEAYDNFVMSTRIGEHVDVRLPVMTCQDGFITSHSLENIELLDDETVSDFVGFYEPIDYMLDETTSASFGPYDSPKFLLEHKRQQAQAMMNAKGVIKDVQEDFYKISGRKYDIVETYKTEDAERIMVIIGSSSGTAKYAVNELREQGEKVGLVKIRVYRPFPAIEIAKELKNAKIVAVMDRAEGLSGIGGPVFADICASTCNMKDKPLMVNYIYGLGGRDFRPEDAKTVFEALSADLVSNEELDTYRYLGVRG